MAMAVACVKAGCGAQVPDGARFCGECGTPRVDPRPESPEAVARYEAVFRDFAGDGMLEDWEQEELNHLRAELGVSDATHQRLVQSMVAAKGPASTVRLDIDAAAMRDYVAGTSGVLRWRVVNEGARALASVRLRFAVDGQAQIADETARGLRSGGEALFVVPRRFETAGQRVVTAFLSTETLAGQQQHWRAEAATFRVATAGGPNQTNVLHLEANALRVADLGGLQTGRTTPEGGLLGREEWTARRLTLVESGEVEAGLAKAAGLAPIAQPPVAPAPSSALPKGHPPIVDCDEAWSSPRGSTPTVVRIPAGTFWMGAGSDDSEADDDEKPRHQVTLTRAMAVWSVSVTQRQYEELTGESPSTVGDSPDCPVTDVSWFDAVRYCNALSRKHGLSEAYDIRETADPEQPEVRWKGLDNTGWRLPTEAEWEYLCRAGSLRPRYGKLEEIAWYDPEDGSDYVIHPVGTKKPNRWGLYDTLGNVWEWCWDGYGAYDVTLVTDPTGPATGSGRVSRGGSWRNGARGVRAAYRSFSAPDYRDGYLGFRPLRSLA